MNKTIILALLFISNIAIGAKPPSAILDQMSILSNIEATISICLDSDEYKKLNSEQALKFHAVSNKIGIIIESIEKRYNDDMAYLVVKMTAMDRTSNSDFKSNFAKIYSRKCAPQILIDTNKALDATSDNIKNLINKR
jgi:hypothetical protein